MLLLRPKRGKASQQRLQELLEEPVFAGLENNLGRVTAVEGDVELPGLGLSESEAARVASSVSVVFHAAATVRFDAAADEAVRVNVDGTRHVLQVAKTLASVAAVVHVSTAFAHCHLGPTDEVKERIYHEEVEKLDAEDPKLCGRPNTYTLTKAMAELVLLEKEFASLPSVVVRPSIIVAARKVPFPGWVDNYNGATGKMMPKA